MNLAGNGSSLRLFEVEKDNQTEQPVLPRGRVEAVLLVDPKLRAELKRNWRLAFDRVAFEHDPGGNPVPLRTTVARVGHCLHALRSVVQDIRAVGLQPVAIRKEEDDRMVVALWRHPRNPPVKEAEVKGFTVSFEELPQGSQAALSEWMAVVNDADAFEF